MLVRKNVLVVDDEKIIRVILKEFLESMGFSVSTARNGDEAISAIKEAKYNAVITDLSMSPTDGFSVCHAAKETDPAIKLIMITGQCRHSVESQAFAHGVDVFMEKPVDMEKLSQHLSYGAS